MRVVRTLVAAAVLGAMAATPATAGALLGTGTLNAADDLTRIQVGASTWEFLDLSATAGTSVEAALNTYSAAGFHWATGTDVAELFSAFGITFVSDVNSGDGTVDLGASGAAITNFVAHLGATGSNSDGTGSLGWIDDLTTAAHHTYACIGLACSPDSFTFNVDSFWPVNSFVGVYLVRDISAAQVPMPATLALLGLGLAGLAWSRRKPD